MLIEKASTIGAQVLSGAVIEPGPLDELLPGWRDNPPPVCVPATEDEFWFLTKTGGYKFPIAPPQMNNHGNFIVSLGAMCAWLAPQAEALGVEIYPGFAAAELLFDDAGAVAGVRIGDMGVAKDGSHKPGYTQGIDIKARLTVLAEGARRMMLEIAPTDASPGALLLFRMMPRAIAKHVGILTGPDTFLHAYERLGVIEEPLTPTWRRRIAFAFFFPQR
jgi:NlpC/P60 family putative phage cell wall peptidase